MAFILPVFWMTSIIRQLKYIAPLSTLANMSMFASLGLIMITNLQNLPPISGRSLIGEWKNIPLCFGTVAYCIEGISLVSLTTEIKLSFFLVSISEPLKDPIYWWNAYCAQQVLPLQQNMKNKEQFLGTFGVHNLSMGFVLFLIMIIGFFGYYKNGDEVAASLTFNLDITNM